MVCFLNSLQKHKKWLAKRLSRQSTDSEPQVEWIWLDERKQNAHVAAINWWPGRPTAFLSPIAPISLSSSNCLLYNSRLESFRIHFPSSRDSNKMYWVCYGEGQPKIYGCTVRYVSIRKTTHSLKWLSPFWQMLKWTEVTKCKSLG